MTRNFKEFTKENKNDFETYLLSHIKEVSGTALENAMNYSLDADGKRLRPLLLLAVLKSFGKSVSQGYPAAAALEMIHTYSLIHDDLPAMDDDELRRGKPTNHIQFNESTAILAGDGLLTLAFQIITFGELIPEIKVKLTALLAETAGYEGMIGGQQADIDGEEDELSLKEIEKVHLRKTGALIHMAAVAGGMIAEQKEAVLKRLENFSKEVGLAYQIRDDILDVVGTEEELGKGVATDAALGKSTYPAILGLEGAHVALEGRLEAAKKEIEIIADIVSEFDPDLLIDFIDQLTLEEYK